MQSAAPLVAFLFLGLFAFSLSSSGLSLPAWVQAPLMRLRFFGQAPDEPGMADDATAVLIHRLKTLDPVREHETAHALHKAIGKILRASGTQTKQAVQHFEAARDAAALGKDQDTLLASHLELAEFYIELGLSQHSQKELSVATGVLAEHFDEHRSTLNRLRGLAKFTSGFPASALAYFADAERQAIQPQDKVRVACDIARVHTCAGKPGEAVPLLKQALEVLHAVHKANGMQFMAPEAGMPTAVQKSLKADVHFQLAEAYHSMQNTAFAEAHYKKALHLQQKSDIRKEKPITDIIKRGIKYLQHGVGPELRCPKLAQVLPGSEARTPTVTMNDNKFITKMNLLLHEQRYDEVESELKASLRMHSIPYKSHEDALALNMLGNVYLKQAKFSKAAKQFRQALHAASVCCGARNRAAQEAYEGLKTINPELSPSDQRVAASAIEKFFDALQNAGVPTVESSGEADVRTGRTSSEVQFEPATWANRKEGSIDGSNTGAATMERPESETITGSIFAKRAALAAMDTFVDSAIAGPVGAPTIEGPVSETITGSADEKQAASAAMNTFFADALKKTGGGLDGSKAGAPVSETLKGSSEDKQAAQAAMDTFFDAVEKTLPADEKRAVFADALKMTDVGLDGSKAGAPVSETLTGSSEDKQAAQAAMDTFFDAAEKTNVPKSHVAKEGEDIKLQTSGEADEIAYFGAPAIERQSSETIEGSSSDQGPVSETLEGSSKDQQAAAAAMNTFFDSVEKMNVPKSQGAKEGEDIKLQTPGEADEMAYFGESGAQNQ